MDMKLFEFLHFATVDHRRVRLVIVVSSDSFVSALALQSAAPKSPSFAE